MPRAFVLLNVETGSEDNILQQLKKIGAVEEAYASYGVYDLIIKVKAGTMEELKETVTHKNPNSQSSSINIDTDNNGRIRLLYASVVTVLTTV